MNATQKPIFLTFQAIEAYILQPFVVDQRPVFSPKTPVDPTEIIQKIAINAVPILFAVILHEVAHGYVAEKLGDPTARMLGRLTLNPIPHIDPVGTILVPLMLLITGAPVFGWARPVPISPVNFRKPDRHMSYCAAAGPATNILLALMSAILLRIVVMGMDSVGDDETLQNILQPLALMLRASAIWNVFLAMFNLIPLLPLDGGRIVKGFLPPKMSYSYGRIEPYGFIILMVLIFTGLTRFFVIPPAVVLLHFLSQLSGVRLP